MDTLLNSPLETVESDPATYAYITNKEYCINLSNLYFLPLSVCFTASLSNINKKKNNSLFYNIINYSYNKLIWLFPGIFVKKQPIVFFFIVNRFFIILM